MAQRKTQASTSTKTRLSKDDKIKSLDLALKEQVIENSYLKSQLDNLRPRLHDQTQTRLEHVTKQLAELQLRMLEYTTQSQSASPTSASQAPPPASTDIQYLSPLTGDQKDHCITLDVCFRCRQLGHKSYQSTCPNLTWQQRAQSPPASASPPRSKTASSTPRLTQKARIDDLTAKLAMLEERFAASQSSSQSPASQPLPAPRSWPATPTVTASSPTYAAPPAFQSPPQTATPAVSRLASRPSRFSAVTTATQSRPTAYVPPPARSTPQSWSSITRIANAAPVQKKTARTREDPVKAYVKAKAARSAATAPAKKPASASRVTRSMARNTVHALGASLEDADTDSVSDSERYDE